VDESTLESVLHQTRDITHALQSTQLFKSVHPEIMKSQRPDATVRDVDVLFRVQERGRLFLKSSTEVGNGEASAVCLVWMVEIVVIDPSHPECKHPNRKRLWWCRNPRRECIPWNTDQKVLQTRSQRTIDSRYVNARRVVHIRTRSRQHGLGELERSTKSLQS